MYSGKLIIAGVMLGLCCLGNRANAAGIRGSMDDWVTLCRNMAMRPADEPIGACESHWQYKQEYDVVYYNDRYLSFKGNEWWYEGGAHGNALITVGVIDRKTGKRLKLADLVPSEKWPKLQKCLYDAVVKKIGGVENLQGEVKPIENFFLDKDGLHFVYNAYEVACFAQGAVDVVVPFPFE